MSEKDAKLIAEILLKLRNTHDLTQALLGILTPAERREILRRFEIVQGLLAKVPHHELAAKLNVGVATVSRGARELRAGHFEALKPVLLAKSRSWPRLRHK